MRPRAIQIRRLDKAKGRNPTFVFLLIRPLFLLRAAGFISFAMLRIERLNRWIAPLKRLIQPTSLLACFVII